MSDNCNNNQTEKFEIATAENETPKSKKSAVFLILSVIALIMFMLSSFHSQIFGIFKGGNKKTVSAISSAVEKVPAKPAYSLDDFKREVEKLRAQHNFENQRLLEDFKRQIQTVGEADFQKARANIQPTVSQICNFKACAQLIFQMTRDKIKKTNEADTFIRNLLNSGIIQPCNAGSSAVQDATTDFLHRLQENDNRFRASCAAELQKLPENSQDFEVGKDFVEKLEQFEQQVGDYLISCAFTSVGTVIELVMIRQTIVILTKLCTPIITKLAGGVAASLLDGPLPIGDIIAIGATVWCGYEIYSLIKILPDKMGKTLSEAIDKCSSQVRTTAVEKAEKAVQFYCESSKKVVCEL